MLWQYDEEKIQIQNTKSVKIGKLHETFVYSEQKQRSVSKDNQWRPVICPQVGIQLIYASGWLLIGQFVPAALASSAYIYTRVYSQGNTAKVVHKLQCELYFSGKAASQLMK